MLLPLQGDILLDSLPRALPWARCFWAFSPFQPYNWIDFSTFIYFMVDEL